MLIGELNMKLAIVTILSLLLIVVVFTGCITSPTTGAYTTNLPVVKDGSKTSFSLNQNEFYSAVVFLESNEYAYVNCVISPTDYKGLVDLKYIIPNGSLTVTADHYDWMRVGGSGKGNYTLKFTYPTPSPDKINTKEGNTPTWPTTCEVVVSCEVTTEYKTK
jgi:hypothetical protein